MAGLFDGEGWISIHRNPAGRNRGTREWSFTLTIALTMRERFLVDEFAKKYGGKVTPQTSKSDRHSQYYKWQGFKGVVQTFDALAGNFVIAKQAHLEVARRFIEVKSQNTNFRPVRDEEYNEFCKLFEDMRILNLKGVGK